MPPREHLRNIRRFDQLVGYLRHELGWPIQTDDFEELTFEYTPEELGIDPKYSAKIQTIMRLRPLAPNQPWGIFFVEFAPKRLPVVALRRILGQVTLKKRASAVSAERQAWAEDDLLFVSNYGEGERRRIALAHFSKPPTARDLPTLKVLGWDNLDTSLHLDRVADELTRFLAWPADENDAEAWRQSWRRAFTLRHQEAIRTSKVLSERLAELAAAIRDRARTAIGVESASGPLTVLMRGFQRALVHDLDITGFADMYAQTITYGLLSARIADPEKHSANDLAANLQTNPFLRELMKTFVRVGGRREDAGESGIDFDELGVSEVVELLDRADMDAVVRDFGDRNPREDPVIHFYEHFLAAYDKSQKVDRGVFYTPRPVVSYIVRSVHEILKSEFGLADGLADTSTWGEMVEKHGNLKIPGGVSSEDTFVKILDPATGTGTFLVEVIDLIHSTMVEKWKALGHGESKVRTLWNDYVPTQLLSRLHGYELLMAPYAIAHLKIGLKLHETGYRFESQERARVYLTNTLEPFSLFADPAAAGLHGALGREAQAVNEVKQHSRFSVVLGNPPYLAEAGRGGDWIAELMRGREIQRGLDTLSYFKVDGEPLNERNPKWLNDLYVRFTRHSHWLLEQTGVGIHCFITNHRYLDNPTFRGMRWALQATFDQMFLVDLHGNAKKREKSPDGSKDENVFDIEQGVAIGLFAKTNSEISKGNHAKISHADCWGKRTIKYNWLADYNVNYSDWADISPRPPFYLYTPFDRTGKEEYEAWTSVAQIFPIKSSGIVTARDPLTIQISPAETWKVVSDFSVEESEVLRKKFNLGRDAEDWKVAWAQNDLRLSGPKKSDITPILYRPFDIRSTYYTGVSRGFLCRPRTEVMGHMMAGKNIGLITCRQQSRKHDDWAQVFVTSEIMKSSTISSASCETNSLFPLYLYLVDGMGEGSLLNQWPRGKNGRIPNLDSSFVERIQKVVGLQFVSDGQGDCRRNFGPDDVLAWIYSVFHSAGYRNLYEAQLKIDFPRVPCPVNAELFRDLAEAGHELLTLHLLDAPKLDEFVADYTGPDDPEVARVGWSDSTVWLDAGRTSARDGNIATTQGTIGFRGVARNVWEFRIGGYQVCHSWLNDRKRHRLSEEDIAHYQRIVVAISETIRVMACIDEIIDDHGGWPDAFRS